MSFIRKRGTKAEIAVLRQEQASLRTRGSGQTLGVTTLCGGVSVFVREHEIFSIRLSVKHGRAHVGLMLGRLRLTLLTLGLW